MALPTDSVYRQSAIGTSDRAAEWVLTLCVSVLQAIQAKIEERQYELSKHAVDQSIIRNISIAEIEEAVHYRSEMIENYPDDKYGPIITLYEPNPHYWLDFRERKSE